MNVDSSSSKSINDVGEWVVLDTNKTNGRMIRLLWIIVFLSSEIAVTGIARSQQLLDAQVLRGSGELPITPIGELAHPLSAIRCKLFVGNSLHTFIVDSGSTANFIDHSLECYASGVGRRVLVKTAGNPIECRFYELIPTSVAGIQVVLKPVASIELKHISCVFGDEIAGILGLPTILKFGLGYSSSSKNFYFGKSPVKSFDRSYRIHISAKEGVFADGVDVGLDNRRYIIDTGMNSPLAVTTEVFNQLEAKRLVTSIADTIVLDVSGKSVRKSGILQRLAVWGTEFIDVPVRVGSENTIGLGLLQRFDFYIDPYNERIELSENSTTSNPFCIGKAGLSFLLDDGAIRVVNVKSESPAAMAGIAVGDEIVQIGNHKIKPDWLGICQASHFLSVEVDQVLSIKLICLRDGKLHEFNIISK
jgi:predicted aspartyl protease